MVDRRNHCSHPKWIVKSGLSRLIRSLDLRKDEEMTDTADTGELKMDYLTVDLDVRIAWADCLLQGSHHASVMPTRRQIEDGVFDEYPVLQGMQFLKNRLAAKQNQRPALSDTERSEAITELLGYCDENGKALLCKIVDRAKAAGGPYRNFLDGWILNGSTIILRDELCYAFGDHAQDLPHFNAFADIDSAALKFIQAKEVKTQADQSPTT